MIKLGMMMVASLCGLVLAQDVVALDASTLPLPESWKANALIVLTVNFILGLIALAVRMIPGKIGDVIQKLIDVVSANVAHKK